MLLLTFLVAVVVNFLGYIPLGNINLTSMQISINKGLKQAIVFATSFSIVEAIFTFILMHFAEWFAGKKQLMVWLGWILIAVFITMGVISLIQAYKKPKPKEESRKRDSIRTGIILGIFNPMIIPFWTIGGTFLIANNWITTRGLGLEIFAIGAGLGSFLCLYLFARFAQYIQNKFSFNHKIINKSIATVFFGLAIFQICRELFFTS
ncbi:lysine transporter LysE [Pedobacter psychrophilus]|uniref:Lysine transporter LysE n=1 Tax=Pedobacter psychrophilus TaxID=1826909 RepID=A0A179DC63_9SPHI|nr:LysE family transporter [Pedobacter psychrophilus]OAQ38636.1 lysine transporter LysE [Pedobacter psychrophilus]